MDQENTDQQNSNVSSINDKPPVEEAPNTKTSVETLGIDAQKDIPNSSDPIATKTTIGGVEDNPQEPKTPIEPKQDNSKPEPKSDQPAEANPPKMAGLNNEIVKSKPYALLALIVGVLLIIGAGVYYYFYVYSSAEPVSESVSIGESVEPLPDVSEEMVDMQEEPQDLSVEEIDNDPIIQEVSALDTEGSVNEILRDLEDIDFEGIDADLQEISLE